MRTKRATNAGEGKMMTSVGHSEQCEESHKLSCKCRHSVRNTKSQSLSDENPSRPSLEKGRSIGNGLAIAEPVRNDEGNNDGKEFSRFTPHTSHKRVAFTLAEVLITLGIIGVVAAITIPTMIANYREKVTVARLTQTYNQLSQAIERMIEDEGGRTIQYWGATSEDRRAKFEELLPKYISVVKTCRQRAKGCLASGNLYKNGVSGSNSYIMGNLPNEWFRTGYLLNNGVGLFIDTGGTCQQDTTLQKRGCGEWDSSCSNSSGYLYGTYQHGCIQLFVDVNGPSGPNRMDADGFWFVVVQNGIVPLGSSKESVWTQTFESNCVSPNGRSSGTCTAWVIYNKNMDYLKCPEKLGWKKASSCK